MIFVASSYHIATTQSGLNKSTAQMISNFEIFKYFANKAGLICNF